jgi:hypothetical protein
LSDCEHLRGEQQNNGNRCGPDHLPAFRACLSKPDATGSRLFSSLDETIKEILLLFGVAGLKLRAHPRSGMKADAYRPRAHWFPLVVLAGLALMLGTDPGIAQAPAAQGIQTTAGNRLMIMIVGGEEPLMNLKPRVAREVIVEVHDENNRPVGAATVTLVLTTRRGTVTATALTTDNGRAALSVTPNAAGTANVSISAAAVGGQAGAIAIPANVIGGLIPAAAAAGTTAASAAGAVAQSKLATKDCTGLFNLSSLTTTEQICSGAVSPNTSPQCMAAVQTLLTQFSQLCSCVGGVAVPQLYSQFGLTAADIDTIGSHAKTVGFSLPPSCLSPTAPTIIRPGGGTVGGP